MKIIATLVLPLWLVMAQPAHGQSQLVLDHVVEAGKTETQVSEEEIILAPGFWAKTGSVFEAYIHVEPEEPADPTLKLVAILEDEMRKQDIVGMAVGVVENGDVIFTRGFGYTDVARTTPVTANTVFRWASISKTLTAVAAFQLFENGSLSLNDRAANTVPYWPGTGDKGLITASHLLTHRSGIVHYGKDYKRSKYHSNDSWNAEQSVAVFKDVDLQFTPGANACYTTFGFGLLGTMVDEAAPNGYVRWIEQNIKDRLGMSSLTELADTPGGYGKDCQCAFEEENEGDVLWKLPGGGWSSNIKDLTRFMQGMMTGELLNNTAAMWAPIPGTASDFPGCGPTLINTSDPYRFGVFRETFNGRLQIKHGGAHDDVRTLMAFFPNDAFGVALMINGDGYVDDDRIFDRIAAFMNYDWKAVVTTPTYPCELDANNDGEPDGCPGTFTGLWRQHEEEVLIRRDYTHEDFYKVWKDLTDAGYVAIDIDTYLTGTVRKWDGLFQKDYSDSAIRRDLNEDEFADAWEDLSNKDYRLIDVETYKNGVNRKWAGIFVEGNGGYALFRGLSTDDFGAKHSELKAKGYQLIDIETYLTGTVRKWAGVWRTGKGSLLNRGYKTDDFVDLVQQRRDDGYMLTDVETYMDGTVRKWAGVWEQSSDRQHFHYSADYCPMIDNYADYIGDGYHLTDLEKY